MTKSYSRFKLWFDRLLSKSLLRQFAVLGIVLIVALGISYLFMAGSNAEWERFCAEKNLNKWLLPLYLLIDSNALNNLYIDSSGEGHAVHGWMLIASSITFLFGAFIFNGAIIGIITNAIERRVTQHREGHIHYLKSGHYIIMGYDDMVPSIITHIFERDKNENAFILLLTSAETTKIKEKLAKSFPEDKMKRIIINFGHRISPDAFKDIHLETAEEVYVVGNHEKPAHDAINVECVDSICRYLNQLEVKGSPKLIVCVFGDLDTYAAFKTSEIFGQVKDLNIEFLPYNIYSGWAKQVFVKQFHKDTDHPGVEIPYPTVYGKKGIKPDDKQYVHLVFVGTTNFAVAFAMEAAHVLHFSNFKKNGDPRTRITFIDKNADMEKDEFITRYRHFFEVQSYSYRDLSINPKNDSDEIGKEFLLFEGDDSDFLDVEFEFIKGDVFAKPVQEEIRKWAEEHGEKQYLSIFIALANQRQNFTLGMNMPDEVYDNEIPVFIRQNRSDNFVSNLRNADESIRKDEKKNTYYFMENGELEKREKLGGRYANIYPFGMNETAYSADEISLERAKLINYLYATADYGHNKFQSVLALDALPPHQIREDAEALWSQLSVAHKWSNLYNAYTINIKMAALRAKRGLEQDDTSQDTWPLAEDEVEMLARIEHNRWNVEKLLMGFRKPHANEDKYNEADESIAKKLKKNKERFIHHDIRPFDSLGNIKELDFEFSRYIPWIIKMTEGDKWSL